MANAATARRARQVARQAAPGFGLALVDLRLVATGIDWTFRGTTDEGQVVALRVGDPSMGQTPTRLASEMAWLAALGSDTGVRFPAPCGTRTGERVVTILDDVELGVTAVEWLDGRRRRALVSVADARTLGTISATLHAHGRNWTPPDWFDLKPWTAERMTGAHRPGDAALDELLGPERAARLRRLDGLVRAWHEELSSDSAAAGLVHGDLHPGNVLWHGREPRVIDLNDAGYCPYAYDLARTIRTLRWRPDGEQHVVAALAGYAAVDGGLPRRWLEASATLEAGADLGALRYYAQLVDSRGPGIGTVIQATADRIDGALDKILAQSG